MMRKKHEKGRTKKSVVVEEEIERDTREARCLGDGLWR